MLMSSKKVNFPKNGSCVALVSLLLLGPIWLSSCGGGSISGESSVSGANSGSGSSETVPQQKESTVATAAGKVEAARFNLTGTLSFKSQGLSLAEESDSLVNLDEVLVKATYAEEEETTSYLDEKGNFTLPLRDKPFSITIFQDELPICNFIFQVDQAHVGSLLATNDLAVGLVNCRDGQALIDAATITDSLDQIYKDSIASGKISDSLRTTLLAEEGLGIVPLLQFDEFKNQRRYSLESAREQLKLAVSPEICREGGFTIPEYFFTSFDRDGNHKSEGAIKFERSMFVKDAGSNGSYYMIFRDKGLDGQAVDRIFPGITLEGAGAEFSLIGSTVVAPADLKAQIAEDRLREVLHSQDTGAENYATPRFKDEICDPLDMVNRILKVVNRAPYQKTSSIFPVPLWETLSSHNYASDYNGSTGGSVKALCSVVMGNEPQSLREACQDSSGKYLTDFASRYSNRTVSEAFASICDAKATGKSVGYWIEKKDSHGKPIKKCMMQTYDSSTSSYINSVVDLPISKCNFYSYDYDSQRYTYYWVQTEYRSMGNDCSSLRLNGYNLRACRYEYDYNLESSYWKNIDWNKYPRTYWGTSLEDLDALILAQESSESSDMKQLVSDIDHCLAPYQRTEDEVTKRMTNIERLLATIDLIQSAVDEQGNKKYISEKAGIFKEAGSFRFTSNEIAALETVLKKAHLAVGRWASDVGKVKEVFSLFKTAALRASNNACTQDQIASESAFQGLYSDFHKAYAGVDGDANLRGIAGWQEVAYNHFVCMDMDSNINKIRNFGLTAPLVGVKGSHRSLSERTKDVLGLVGADEAASDDCDFINWQSRCVKNIRCKVPSGASTYVPFDYLIDTAVITPGCDQVETKLGIIGRKNRQEKEINGVEIKSGDITASMHLMTSLTSAGTDFNHCKITLKMPKIDANGCFVYQNAEGKNWADLTNDELKSADPNSYPLSYLLEEISLKDISHREVMDVILKPTSELK
jgi:hypothetical protein